MSLACPLCREALLPAEKSYRCLAGHSFDLAREGYLSLLHGRQKGDGRGDTKAMMQARDRVHQAGVFAPLVDALTALPLPRPVPSILELGCGEGFFLEHMARAHGSGTRYGLDLSVDAVKLAARRQPAARILRADLLQPLPFADGSLDLVQSIFAPRPLTEILRVLRPGGHLVLVYPQPDHWQEVRAFVTLAAIGADKLAPDELTGFSLVADRAVTAPCDLTREQLVDLVAMSPSIHRLTREGPLWSDGLPPRLTATLSVRVLLLRKP